MELEINGIYKDDYRKMSYQVLNIIKETNTLIGYKIYCTKGNSRYFQKGKIYTIYSVEKDKFVKQGSKIISILYGG